MRKRKEATAMRKRKRKEATAMPIHMDLEHCSAASFEGKSASQDFSHLAPCFKSHSSNGKY